MTDNQNVKNLQRSLAFLRTAVGELGLIQLIMLLEIFERDGITQYELAEDLGLLQGTVSKNCRRFATVEKHDRKTGETFLEGMDLIKLRPDPHEYRRLACFLTGKGKQVKHQLYQHLNAS